jgi:hypothetical protein
MEAYKKIPYGISSYKTIRQQSFYYVDKTRFIPALECAGNFLFLIRPRRFGKSSFLTVLESYYDIARQDEFDLLFKDTDIYHQPTPEKHAYLVLKFNFSQIDPRPEKVEASFQGHAKNSFFFFEKKYRDFLGSDYFEIINEHQEAHQKLEFLLRYVGSIGQKIYVLIDEYDNFANTILTTAGTTAYHELTHGTGFFRFFFNVLKGATDQVDSGIGRMFITDVSPITMDDVTSGFNIGRSIHLHPEFNTLLGFTEQDVVELLTYYEEQGKWKLVSDTNILALLKEWYDQYRFAAEAPENLFNPDMVLYFVKNFLELGHLPETMIDRNIRVDYGKLRHLVVLDKHLNGNFSQLEAITEHGEIRSKVVDSFPVEALFQPENFVSLLFYFGLLSYKEIDRLTIPNQTVKQLMYSYLREGYRDVDVFNVNLLDFANLMRRMAYHGEWEPVFRFLADEVRKQTSIRDYLTGEKVIQTFLLAYLNVTDYYLTRTEDELGKGWVDLYLEPFWQKYEKVRHGYLIELKYVKRDEWSDERGHTELQATARQLRQYSNDPRVSRNQHLTCVALIFCGWELKLAEEISGS